MNLIPSVNGEDPGQPAHMRRLAWVFTIHSINSRLSRFCSMAKARNLPDCMEAQAGLVLCWSNVGKNVSFFNIAIPIGP